MLSTQGTIKNSQVKSQINTLIQKYNKENTKPKFLSDISINHVFIQYLFSNKYMNN